MAQRALVNRYIHEKSIYIAHVSPFMSLADALDILFRIGYFFFGHNKLSLRQAVIYARATFAMVSGDKFKQKKNRSNFLAWFWLSFLLLTPAGTIFESTGIVLTQVLAGFFVFSIVIWCLVYVIPGTPEDEEDEMTKKDNGESGLAHKADAAAAWQARIITENHQTLERASHTFQICGFAASLSVYLYAILRFCLFKIPYGIGINLIILGLCFIVGPAIICVMFTILYALSWPRSELSAASSGGQARKERCCWMGRARKRSIKKEDWLFAALQTQGLMWVSVYIVYYAGLYDRCHTSRAGVSEWFQ